MLRAIDTNCMTEWYSPAETLTPVCPKKGDHRPSPQGRVKYWASLGGSWILPRSGRETEEGFFIKVLQTTTKHSPPLDPHSSSRLGSSTDPLPCRALRLEGGLCSLPPPAWSAVLFEAGIFDGPSTLAGTSPQGRAIYTLSLDPHRSLKLESFFGPCQIPDQNLQIGKPEFTSNSIKIISQLKSI